MKHAFKTLIALLLPSIVMGAALDIRMQQRNSANTAWRDVIFTATPSTLIGISSGGVPGIVTAINPASVGATTRGTGAFTTLAASGVTTLGTTAGFNLTLSDYTAGTTRPWSIRDDSGIDRLRFARGSSDYAVWDVQKTVGADSVTSQTWYVTTEYAFQVGGAAKFQISTIGAGVGGLPGTGTNVLGIANGTAPSTSPAGLGQLYVEGGALKFRGTSGTVTTIAPP